MERSIHHSRILSQLCTLIILASMMGDALAHSCHRHYRHRVRHHHRSSACNMAIYNTYPIANGSIWATQCDCVGGGRCCGGWNADFYPAQPWQYYESNCNTGNGWYFDNSDWVSSDYDMTY